MSFKKKNIFREDLMFCIWIITITMCKNIVRNTFLEVTKKNYNDFMIEKYYIHNIFTTLSKEIIRDKLLLVLI